MVLAIKGHPTRGKEVIEILEMLGGTNRENCWGIFETRLYLINTFGYIEDRSLRDNSNYQIYTLEEFLEKFPYKVGDRVRVCEYESEVCISRMYWDGYEVQYEVVTDEAEWYSARELNEFNEPNKEENFGECIEKTINECLFGKKETAEDIIKIDIPKGYEFVGVDDNKQQIVFTKIQPQYPKTYEECHKLMVQWKGCDCNPNSELILCDAPIHDFCKLIVARNIYWKIAGEQMGLGKPWEPDWTNDEWPDMAYICYDGKSICKENGFPCCNIILIFPTAEMRDAFYENFKDLIEQCKELL